MARETQTGALYQPRGVGWGGRWREVQKGGDICMLRLLLSRFSRVWLCTTPWTAAYQASPSMGFSRQEHWSGLPFPSPGYMYTYGWFMLRFGRKQQNSVKQLSFNKKKKKIPISQQKTKHTNKQTKKKTVKWIKCSTYIQWNITQP